MRDFSTDVSSSEVFDFSWKDIDFETDVLMPRISLTDNIKVWGDYFANVNHESAVKSTFRMYIDYEEVVKSAFAAAKYYVRGKDVVTTKWDHDDDPLTEEVDCLPEPSRPDFDRKSLEEAQEDERDVILEEWNQQFTVFDADYFEQRVIFLEELDAQLAEKINVKMRKY